MKNFYLISASEDLSVPLFFDETWKPALPEFNQVVENPARSMFVDHYELEADLDEFNVDIIAEQYIASEKFIRLCEKYLCSFISIPLVLKLRRKVVQEGVFNFFCILSRHSLLDTEKSEYTLMDERLLRPLEERINRSPVYDRIDRLVPRFDVFDDLFYCEEVKQLVCSDELRAEYLATGMVGFEFEKIDENFVYASWSLS